MMKGARNAERSPGRDHDAPVLTMESEILRAGAPAEGHGHAPPPPPKGEERLPVFWRIFGSTVLSIAALVAITLYQQVTCSLNELRNDQNRLNQDHGDLIKKDEFHSRVMALSNGIKELQAANAAAADVWRERAASLERQLKAGEDERKQMAREHAREMQWLRERLAAVEGRQPTAPPAKRSP
jgi:hypothetical protein